MQLCGSLNILWHWLYLGFKWKLTFSKPEVTAEFSKFAGILSVALSQHQLLGFEIAQLEFKEIQPVHPKEDQSWVLTGRTDAEAETTILGPPDAKSWLIE